MNVAAFRQIDLRPASEPASDPDRPAKRVTDTKFWLTAAALNVAMIADTKSTFDVVHRCDICYEKNPYAAPFVARGPVVTYAAGEAFDIGVMVVAAKMKGSENKFYRRTWWVVPIALTTGHVHRVSPQPGRGEVTRRYFIRRFSISGSAAMITSPTVCRLRAAT